MPTLAEVSALEAYEGFYGDRPSPPDSASPLLGVLGSLNLAVRDMPHLLGHLVVSLPDLARQLHAALIEQQAASELQRRFGPPASLLAVPVSLLLAQKSEVAREVVSGQLHRIDAVLSETLSSIECVILAFVEQLEHIEFEIAQAELAQAELKTLTEPAENIVGLKVSTDEKLSKKKKRLQTERQLVLRQLSDARMMLINTEFAAQLRRTIPTIQAVSVNPLVTLEALGEM